MSMQEYRPSLTLRVAWVGLLGLFGAVRGSPQRWRGRVWQLGGGALGALIGVPGAALLVGLWSILTLRLDPDALPPSLTRQSADGVVVGFLVAVLLASSPVGSLGAVLGRRVIRRDVTTSR